jgi:lipopolysaccharide biosynthesis regulator YciM
MQGIINKEIDEKKHWKEKAEKLERKYINSINELREELMNFKKMGIKKVEIFDDDKKETDRSHQVENMFKTDEDVERFFDIH